MAGHTRVQGDGTRTRKMKLSPEQEFTLAVESIGLDLTVNPWETHKQKHKIYVSIHVKGVLLWAPYLEDPILLGSISRAPEFLKLPK